MFHDIAAALSRGESAALLTVVRVNGAAPCAPGTRVLVRDDGSLIGTLGGATVDSRAREDGLRALSSGESGMLTYHLDPESGEAKEQPVDFELSVWRKVAKFSPARAVASVKNGRLVDRPDRDAAGSREAQEEAGDQIAELAGAPVRKK